MIPLFKSNDNDILEYYATLKLYPENGDHSDKEYMFCQICTVLPYEPKECIKCSKVLCGFCIKQLKKNECPFCKYTDNSNSKDKIFIDLNLHVKRFLNSTQILCRCGENFKYEKILSSHMKECLKNKAPCIFCKKLITFDQLKEHYGLCPQIERKEEMVQCKRCKELVPKKQAKIHETKECPKRLKINLDFKPQNPQQQQQYMGELKKSIISQDKQIDEQLVEIKKYRKMEEKYRKMAKNKNSNQQQNQQQDKDWFSAFPNQISQQFFPQQQQIQQPRQDNSCANTRLSHNWGNFKKYDAKIHVTVCRTCQLYHYQDHNFSQFQQSRGGCRKTCQQCGEQQVQSHSYGNYQQVNDYHCQRTCNTCGYVNQNNHKFTGLKKQNRCQAKCEYCGYTKTWQSHAMDQKYRPCIDLCTNCRYQHKIQSHNFAYLGLGSCKKCGFYK